jgi:hypothetical protein
MLVEFHPNWLKFDPCLGFLCTGLGDIRPFWKKIANFGVNSAKISGGN